MGSLHRATVRTGFLEGWIESGTYEKLQPVQKRLLSGLVASNQAGEEVPLACWAPGTDMDIVTAFSAASRAPEGTSLSASYYIGSRWSTTATDGSGLGRGDPTTITWGLLPDGVNITINELGTEPSSLIELLDTQYGAGPGGTDLTQRPWFPLVQQVFDRWGSLIGVKYVYHYQHDLASFPGSPGVLGVRPDVRIGSRSIDGPSGILAFNYFPNNGDMVIDSFETALLGNPEQNSLGLRNLLAHEHGHGLGLLHSCPQDGTKLMEPIIFLDFDGPQHDDIVGANRSYGDRHEYPFQNDGPSAATALGSLAPGDSLLETHLSIDGGNDVDYFGITLVDRTRLSVTLTPVGFRYMNSPQLAGNECPLGTFRDTRRLNDLGFELIAPDGEEVLRSAAFRAVGLSESIDNVILDRGDGTYYIHVFGDSNNVQLYDLSIRTSAGEAPVAVCKNVKACSGTVNPGRVNKGSFDPDDDPITVDVLPAGPYPPGVTNVQLIVSDGILADTCDATVTVNRPPVASAAAVVVDGDSTGSCENAVGPGMVDSGSADPDGDDLTLELVPPGPYPTGTTEVVLIATDPCGLSDSASATVTVNCMVPVELLTLDVERSGRGAVLNWEVASASDHAGFHVFREEPGTDRVKLSDRLLAGRTRYEFVDPAPPAGRTDYWLQELGRSGSTTWYGPVILEAGLTADPILNAVYPNPFTSSTVVRYSLSGSRNVKLVVYDPAGRRVKVLVDEIQGGGDYRASWDGTSANGSQAPAGMYFIQLRAGSESWVKKVVFAP